MSLVDTILAKVHESAGLFPVYLVIFAVVITFFPHKNVLKYGLQILYTALATLNIYTVLLLYRSLRRNPLNENYGIIVAALFSIFCSCIFVVATSGFDNIISRNWYEIIEHYVLLCLFGIVALFIVFKYFTAKGDSSSNNQSQQSDVAENGYFTFMIAMLMFLLGNVIVAHFIFAFCFHPPNDSVIQILNSTEEINHYFLKTEGIYISEEPVMKIQFVENHVIDRSHPAMYTWYSKNGNAGHVSLQLATGSTYLSHWPNDEGYSASSMGKDEKGSYLGIQSNAINDIISEKGLPDHILIFKKSAKLNEEKILEWHNQKTAVPYHIFVANCISYVNEALKVGEVMKSQMLRFLPFNKLNPSTRYYADCVRMEFYSSGYSWLDFLYLAHSALFKLLLTISCVIFCWIIIQTSLS